jgi:hypothetical protein
VYLMNGSGAVTEAVTSSYWEGTFEAKGSLHGQKYCQHYCCQYAEVNLYLTGSTYLYHSSTPKTSFNHVTFWAGLLPIHSYIKSYNAMIKLPLYSTHLLTNIRHILKTIKWPFINTSFHQQHAYTQLLLLSILYQQY